jgi:DnaJ-class molecular chaperone
MLGFDESTPNRILSGEWWEVLGVNQTAHPQDVKLAYRQLARLYHPDVNDCAIAGVSMQAINQAYQEFQQQLKADTNKII